MSHTAIAMPPVRPRVFCSGQMLTLFRAGLGLVLAATPWLFGHGLDGYGCTVVVTGVAIVLMGVASAMRRVPGWRGVQVVLALSVFFLPFAFGDAVEDSQIYCAVLLGKALLLTAIVSPELFDEPEQAR